MVRREVKIGAVVFAILVVVVIAYFAVAPSQPRGGVAVTDDQQWKQSMIDAERAAAESATKKPAASNEPAVVSTGTPPDPFASPAGGKVDANERWMLALNTGVIGDSKVTGGARQQPADANAPLVTSTPGGAGSKPATGFRDNTVFADSAPATPQGARTHIIQQGESIARIAESYYGTQAQYKLILEANPGLDPHKLRPGTVIVVPEFTGETAAGRGTAGASTSSHEPVGGGVQTIDSRTEYRVATGDSMHKIAMKLYGKSEMWEKIYQLNKDQIGPNPAKLKVGMVLKLPVVPAGESR